MKIEIGKLYRIKGNIPISSNDMGFIMAAYLFHPRNNFHNKETISEDKPFIMSDEVVLVISEPMFPTSIDEAVHILYEDKIFCLRTDNLTYL